MAFVGEREEGGGYFEHRVSCSVEATGLDINDNG